VKNVVLTLCNPPCTQSVTLWQSISQKQTEMADQKLGSTCGKTTKTGGSDPTFWAFSRPKSFSGSLPPCGTLLGAGSFPTAADQVQKINS
jgi:hypothetical protein